MSVESLQRDIEEELYTAIQAMEDGDLQRARGCTARAHADIIEHWQILRNSQQEKKK